MKFSDREVRIINKVLSVRPFGSITAKITKPAWVGGEPKPEEPHVEDYDQAWADFEREYGFIEMPWWERWKLWIQWVRNLRNKPTEEDWDFFEDINREISDIFEQKFGRDDDDYDLSAMPA